jgi:hypothetical protein
MKYLLAGGKTEKEAIEAEECGEKQLAAAAALAGGFPRKPNRHSDS